MHLSPSELPGASEGPWPTMLLTQTLPSAHPGPSSWQLSLCCLAPGYPSFSLLSVSSVGVTKLSPTETDAPPYDKAGGTPVFCQTHLAASNLVEASLILPRPITYHVSYCHGTRARPKGAQTSLSFKPAVRILVRHSCWHSHITGCRAGRPLSAPLFTGIRKSYWEHPSPSLSCVEKKKEWGGVGALLTWTSNNFIASQHCVALSLGMVQTPNN